MDKLTPDNVLAAADPRPARPLRVGYVAGPSDADSIYEDLKSGRPRTYFGTNYMRQFLLLMELLRAEALIEIWHGRERYRRRIGPYIFSNVPQSNAGGLAYHLHEMGHMLGVLWRLLRFRPDIVVLTGKQEYWWLLAPLRLTKARFVASFHGAIFPPFHPLKRHAQAALFLNRHLMLKHLSAAVSTSRTISKQLLQLAGSHRTTIPLFQHLPTWKSEDFEGITPADGLPPTPFNIMFMGRIERDKGVYDLIDIAESLRQERPEEFVFHLCGDGNEFAEVERQVKQRSLEDVIVLHGYCPPNRMKQVMSACAVGIVPTRTECPAGFEMTCAEIVLAGRPLVTSAVAPALDYLRPASVEVQPDDVAAYKDAIVRLKDDHDLYREKREACAGLRDQFFDYDRSWDFAMREAFAAVVPDGSPRSQVRY